MTIQHHLLNLTSFKKNTVLKDLQFYLAKKPLFTNTTSGVVIKKTQRV